MNASELAGLKVGDRVVVAGRTGEHVQPVVKATAKTVTVANGRRFSRASGIAFEYSFTPSRIIRLA